MSNTSPSRRAGRKPPFKDRRAGPDARGAAAALRQAKGALARPLALEWRDRQLHVVLVDRRRRSREDAPPSLEQVLAELGARVLAHQHDHAAEVMRHLVFVHDELSRKDWPGIEALPARVLGRALVQAEMLASEESSAALGLLIERLRSCKAAAELREERQRSHRAAETGERVEVSEATAEEFYAIERHWVDTVQPALERVAPAEPAAAVAPPSEADSGQPAR